MKKRFTKKQLDVMKVLWESDTPMVASDIVRKDDTCFDMESRSCCPG